ncbi:uncharacterized protein LOC132734509 isoform X2 [Ruditapes philippinarum]|nr:uncharacterized protein LOC132734509 isoform X2 [Ruditapes philippinarum]XP_060577251.1 uncharacterized protein LOC132734509 isoform X2 [Ruditapes philippinarum]XP_060577252.1 uncharacterized protein LOC132734509 isoform X2 [Ruditapes philippinarum]
MESNVDDNEFVVQAVEGLQTFVRNELVKMRTLVNEFRDREKEYVARIEALERQNDNMHALEKDNRELKEEISQLKAENIRIWSNIDSGSHKQCAAKMQTAFTAGLAAVMASAQQDDSSQYPHHNLISASPVWPITSTPEDRNKKATLSLRRKCPPSTSQLNTTLEDLEENIRESIKPFYKPDRRASADLLTEVQRAFVKYRVSTMLKKKKEAISPARIEQLIAEGVEHRIWLEGFVVGEGTSDFNSYLLNRIRNEKKGTIQKKGNETSARHDLRLFNFTV